VCTDIFLISKASLLPLTFSYNLVTVSLVFPVRRLRLLSSIPTASSAELSSSTPISSPAPARVMGFRDLFLFYVVTGVSLRWIATAAGHGPSSLVIWLGAWLFLYIPLAVSVITLSSRFPAEGGFYVWTKKAFGEGAGFLSAWMYWTSNLPYFPAVLYFAASNVLFLHSSLQHFSGKPIYFIGFSVFFLCGLTVLNLLGLNLAKWAHNLGAIAMWIPVLIIVVLGFASWAHFGSATSLTPRSFIPPAHVQDMIFWSIIIFSFIGCESASLMAEEIKDARRNIPRALLFAGITVALCYMLGTFCVLLAVPSSESSNLDGLAQAIAMSSARFHLSGVTEFAALLIAFSNIGAAGAYLAAAARLPFVAGLDGYLPRAFGQLHPRWKTPWVSVLAQGLFGILFVFLAQPGTSVNGAYNVLVAISVVVTMVPFLFLFASLIRLENVPPSPGDASLDPNSLSPSNKNSVDAKPFRVPGGRPVAIALASTGFLTAAFSMALSLIPDPSEPHKFLYLVKTLGCTAVLIGVGLALFLLGRRRKPSM
jgi:amino acid transporter